MLAQAHVKLWLQKLLANFLGPVLGIARCTPFYPVAQAVIQYLKEHTTYQSEQTWCASCDWWASIAFVYYTYSLLP